MRGGRPLRRRSPNGGPLGSHLGARRFDGPHNRSAYVGPPTPARRTSRTSGPEPHAPRRRRPAPALAGWRAGAQNSSSMPLRELERRPPSRPLRPAHPLERPGDRRVPRVFERLTATPGLFHRFSQPARRGVARHERLDVVHRPPSSTRKRSVAYSGQTSPRSSDFSRNFGFLCSDPAGGLLWV
jgi:hypothetical protein